MKGPWDGAGGDVKMGLERVFEKQKVDLTDLEAQFINSLAAIHKLCVELLSTTARSRDNNPTKAAKAVVSGRVFHIARDVLITGRKPKVAGIQKIHRFIIIPATSVMLSSSLSCWCPDCREGSSSSCSRVASNPQLALSLVAIKEPPPPIPANQIELVGLI